MNPIRFPNYDNFNTIHGVPLSVTWDPMDSGPTVWVQGDETHIIHTRTPFSSIPLFEIPKEAST
jgi:hypothetical protein